MEASRMREHLNNDETVMDANNPTEAEEMHVQNAAREAFLAVDFLVKSDMKRFGSLLAELENSYTHGVDGYPVTLASSFDMVVNYRDPSKYCTPTHDVNDDGMSFFNDQGEPHDQQVSQGRGHEGAVPLAEEAVEVMNTVTEVDGDKDSTASRAVIFTKPWATMMTIMAMSLDR